MAITVAQKLTFFQTGGTSLLCGPFTVSRGNRLVIVHTANTADANVTGPGTFQQYVVVDGPIGGSTIGQWTKRTDGTDTAFSFLYGVSCTSACILYELHGAGMASDVVATSIQDRQSTASGSGVTSFTCTNASANIYPDDIIIMGIGVGNTTGALVSMTGGISDDTSGGINGPRFFCGSGVLSAIQTTSCTITWTTARSCCACLATLRSNALDIALPIITPS